MRKCGSGKEVSLVIYKRDIILTDYLSERIVVEGSILKFEQNKELKQKLMDTGESVLVEASPRDKIWGIGLGEKKAKLTARSKEGWGLNLLGVALMKARNEMRLLPDVL